MKLEKPETVRIATPADIEALYWQLLIDLEADNSLQIPVSEAEVLATVKSLCSGAGGIAGIIDGPHKPIASIGIHATRPWFSKQWMLAQVWLFVLPDERKGHRFADDLFRFAQWHREDMSEHMGYEMALENSILTRNRLEAKTRLWGRYGEHIGSIFLTTGESNGQLKKQ